jgi:hypothetical protein
LNEGSVDVPTDRHDRLNWTERAGLAIVAVVLSTIGAGMTRLVWSQSADHPDLTGVWGAYREPGQPRRRFRDAPEDLPLTPEARAKVEEYNALVGPTGDTPGGLCLGAGMPGSMLGSGGYPMEIVQHEDLIVVIYEAHTEVRHIYIADALVADEADLFPDRNGYSVGHWEGDKLIVETTHLKDAVDQRQYPHSDQARIIEVYELTEDDDGSKTLTASMTLVDPEYYTQNVETVKRWTYLPGTRLLPYECNEPAWEERLEALRSQQAAAE